MMCKYCGVESVSSADGVCPNCGRDNNIPKAPESGEYRKEKPQSGLLDRISDYFAGIK